MSLPRELFMDPDSGEPGDLRLRCPESGKPLIYFPQDRFLFCPASRLRYPITEEGIPVMLIDEAQRLSPDEAARLVARARELGLVIPP